MAIEGPEQELVHAEWESTLEQVSWSFFEWNSAKGLGWGGIVPSELDWPGLVSIVGSSGVLKWHGQPASWQEGSNTAGEWLV